MHDSVWDRVHKGIPEYSKHNSPSSMTGDHTMHGRFQKNEMGSSFVGVVATPPKPLACG